MITSNINAVIHVTDFTREVGYYKDVLGFSEDFRVGDYVGLVLENICIHLSGPENPGRKKIPGNAHICIDCDEVDSYFKDISNKGALISVPLANRFYGVRDFAVDDYDGNTLVFGCAVKSD